MFSSSRKRRRPGWAFLLALLVLLGCGRGGSGPRRLMDFSVEFGENRIPNQMAAGQKVSAEVLVKNSSKNPWPSKPDAKGHRAVNLSYHWLDRRGAVVVFDGERTPLPHDVNAGEAVRLSAMIQAPDRAGNYTLEVTMVQEAVAWFPERDGDKLTIPVVVVEAKPSDRSLSAKQIGVGIKSPVESKPNVPVDRSAASSPKETAATAPSRREKTSPAPDASGTVGAQRGRGAGEWTVQVGAFPQPGEAASLAASLRKRNHDAYVVRVVVNGREWHRVRVGRLASRAEARQLQEILKDKEGLKQTLVTDAR